MAGAVKDLTKGSPMKLIVGFMVPMLLGLLFQQFYNMVDTVVVGQYLGVDALAGVGSTGSVNFLVLGFCMGLCAGFAIPVAQKFGEKDYVGLRRFVANTIWLGVAFAVIIATATALLCGNILTWMNTPKDVFGYAYDYIFIIFLGIPVTFLYNILSGFIRSLGDSKSPVIFLVISSIINVGLDILFIVAFNMGVSGAGLATVLAQLISGILCFTYIVKKFPLLHLKKEDLRPDIFYVGRLCSVGIPMGLQYSITAIGSILLQSAVNTLGKSYVAAITAGSKVSQFACCPFDAMGSTMATYCGQNVGAGKPDRISKGIKDCSILGIGYAIIAFVVLFFFGGNIAMLFIDGKEASILDMAKQFLIINVSFYIPLAFVNIIRFAIQGMGNSRLAVFAGVFEMIARGGVAIGLVPLLGYNAACFASPAAWVLADIFLFPAYFYTLKIIRRRCVNIPAND